MEFVGVYYEV